MPATCSNSGDGDVPRRITLEQIAPAEHDDAYLLALIENLQREDMSAKEEYNALEILVRERGWSTRRVANLVKRSPAYVSKRLRVFEDPVLAPLVLHNQLPVSTAEELLGLSARRKRSLARAAIDGAWNRARIRAATGVSMADKPKRRSSIAVLVRQLRGTLRNAGDLAQLSEVDRAQLRMLYTELTIMARATPQHRSVILTQAPVVRASSS